MMAGLVGCWELVPTPGNSSLACCDGLELPRGGLCLAVEGAGTRRDLGLRMKGLNCDFRGPEEAEGYFRKALAQSTSGAARACAGLSGRCAGDQGRYAESKDMPEEALKAGRSDGKRQDSMADLLLSMRSDPERAMAMAEERCGCRRRKPGRTGTLAGT